MSHSDSQARVIVGWPTRPQPLPLYLIAVRPYANNVKAEA